MTTHYTKPRPRPMNETLSKPFWEATKRHELVMPRCRTCSKIFFYPREQCPNCYSSDLDWTQVSGKGRLYTFTVVHQTAHPAFQPESPHIYAIIQLNEGPRMPSNLIGCEYRGRPHRHAGRGRLRRRLRRIHAREVQARLKKCTKLHSLIDSHVQVFSRSARQ